MEFCKQKEYLSREARQRSSYYQVVRDELDQFVLEHSLVGSYANFVIQKAPYPVVELRSTGQSHQTRNRRIACSNS